MAQKKTPAQRAEEALGVAERRVDKTTTALEAAKAAVVEAAAAAAEAKARLVYVAQNPDLPEEVRAKHEEKYSTPAVDEPEPETPPAD